MSYLDQILQQLDLVNYPGWGRFPGQNMPQIPGMENLPMAQPQPQQSPRVPQGPDRDQQMRNMAARLQQATDPVQQQRIRQRMEFLQGQGAATPLARPQVRPGMEAPIMPAGAAGRGPSMPNSPVGNLGAAGQGFGAGQTPPIRQVGVGRGPGAADARLPLQGKNIQASMNPIARPTIPRIPRRGR